MRPENLDFLVQWLAERTGFALGRDQMHLVESRLFPVARKYALGDLDTLVGELRGGGGRTAELPVDVVDAMMTSETAFFRDPGAFVELRDRILPGLVAARGEGRRLRIWCAGSSTGQEAYSMAMLIRRPEVGLDGWQVDVVATDVSRQAIERARAGSFSHFEAQLGMPVQQLLRHFRRQQDRWIASDTLRRSITFRELNLLGDQDSLGTFDVVLCRYVLRAFTDEARATILGKLASRIAADGVLWLGAGEDIPDGVPGFGPIDGVSGFFAPTRGEAAA